MPSRADRPLHPETAAPSDRTRAVVHAHLGNGLEVVIVPDDRAPVVTHMIWYRCGAADDRAGASGTAHFLEHLMFKGTHRFPPGRFVETVSACGGRQNAFTALDVTAYFQSVPKRHLSACMAFEADRMTNLAFDDRLVAMERDVVLEERRMYTDADPAEILQESLQATVFSGHPYGRPVIGWQHEIEALDQAAARAFYRDHYRPGNATLVVAGDVEPEAVLALARETYGLIPGDDTQRPPRRRPRQPAPTTRQQVRLADDKVGQARYRRIHRVPSYATAGPREAEALDLLGFLLGDPQTGLLHRALVTERRVAVSASASYIGVAIDETTFAIDAVPAPGVSLETLEAAIEAVLADLREALPEDAVARAKTRLAADAIYMRDSATGLAHWYGLCLSIGRSMAQLSAWPAPIAALETGDLHAALQRLDLGTAVCGFLQGRAAPAIPAAA